MGKRVLFHNVLDLFERRRSIRFYKRGRRLPAEKLRELFRLTSLAPSAFNLQPWEFLLLQEPESKQKLFDNGCSQQQVLMCSALVIVLGNKDPAAHAEEVFQDFVEKGYFNEKIKERQVRVVKDMSDSMSEAERRVWTMRSSVLACQQLMLAATALGIDSGPMEGFDHEKVRTAFHIPDNYEIVMLISLGAREKDPLERLLRRGYDVIVHEERF